MPESLPVRFPDGAVLRLPARPDLTLAQALFLAGVWVGLPLCSGLGRCGRCRVQGQGRTPEPVPAERGVLSSDELAQGWRLACRHPAQAFESVNLPRRSEPRREAPGAQRGRGTVSLAVDLGTTSIGWSLTDREGTRSFGGHELNPQLGAGSEIMSRLAFAARPEQRAYLRALVLDRLVELCDGHTVDRLAVAGNSAMTYILLGLDVTGLSFAPYRLGYKGGEWRELSPGLPPAYIPPLLAPFVGGDLSAGLAAIRFGRSGIRSADMAPPEYPFLLADLGTNGEFVLAVGPEEFVVASVPMGPALEGIGLRFGSVAGPGTVTGFDLAPSGLLPRWYDGHRPDGAGRVERISGTGYLSLLAMLKRAGLLGRAGGFEPGSTPLAARIASRIRGERDGREEYGERRLYLSDGSDGAYLAASDVEEVLKVKAAFNLALALLLRASGLPSGGLRHIYLAGALGEHVALGDLEELGFLPPGSKGRVVIAGNTSLAGAEAALDQGIGEPVRDWLAGLPERVRLVEPAARTTFTEEYVARMVFEYVP